MDNLKPPQVVDLPSFRSKVSLSYMRNTSSSRSLQLLASFGWVLGNASSIPELLVILKPSEVVDLPSFRLKVSLFYEGQFLQQKLSASFQFWKSSRNYNKFCVLVLVVILKPPLFSNISKSWFNPSATMYTLQICITTLFLDSHIPLRIKGGCWNT